MSDVQTRWPRFLDDYSIGRTLTGLFDATTGWQPGETVLDRTHLDDVIYKVHRAPWYVFTDETVTLLDSERMEKTNEALVKAGLTDLPNDIQVVEFNAASGPAGSIRLFIIVAKRVLGALPGERGLHPYCCTVFSTYIPKSGKYAGQTFSCLYPFQIYARLDPPNKFTTEGRFFDTVTLHHMVVRASFYKKDYATHENAALVVDKLNDYVFTAIRGLLIMSNMRGIERESVSVPKLNKARAKSKKRPIQDHTIVHLGYYYTRTGERRKFDPKKDRIKSMYIMPPHERTQRYGPKLSQSKRIKLEGWIANYDPNLPAPKPKIKVVVP